MTDSIDYYNKNASIFFHDTVNVEMTDLYARFLKCIPKGGEILDAGCGSGRDSKFFKEAGFRVSAFDASEELAKLASAHAGINVAVKKLNEIEEFSIYDGIWACASLLHVKPEDMPDVLKRILGALKPGGTLYLSFKYGAGERSHNGRIFTDVDELQLRKWIASIDLEIQIETWKSIDQRPGRNDEWLNAIIKKPSSKHNRLVTGGKDHFLPHLTKAINEASEIDMAVAFIKATGLKLIMDDLHSAITRGYSESIEDIAHLKESARLRVITSDYLDVTDPQALRQLLVLRDRGAQVKIYESSEKSFHMKAYIFNKKRGDGGIEGKAFIGSSNLSAMALRDGLEWNYRIDYPADSGFIEARNRFEELFSNNSAVNLTDDWIDAYEKRRKQTNQEVEPGSHEQENVPTPTNVQKEALAALEETRKKGYMRGLVVLATGLGKTWLAAFHAKESGAKKVLFVAHREEILNQAADTFIKIYPQKKVGLYTGKSRDTEVDILCASIQTLSRTQHLERFRSQHFDFIVVDEFHHAAAPTYHRLLDYFTPHFLLGLTATPDRTDQSSILTLCDDNLVYTCNLFRGIQDKLLSPFHYYGIFDESVNYKEIPWRNGRFEPELLANKLATLGRARHALRQWRQYKQKCTLAFCVSIRHAEFMAAYFSKEGVLSAAVYAGSSISRADALEQLEDGRLEIIFSVDLFSEGMDLPGIDTILMLRPTESKVLFLQQIGRGLRKADQKSHLVVLDFIGNHQGFLHKPQALMGQTMNHQQLADFAKNADANNLDLPSGCYVNYDLKLIDFMKSFSGSGVDEDYKALRDGLGRRPTIAEFYRYGASISQVRQGFGGWFELVEKMGDLTEEEKGLLNTNSDFFHELEVTAMNKSYKMVLLEAFLELDGWAKPIDIETLSSKSFQVLHRRKTLFRDLPENLRSINDATSKLWQSYWKNNPINAWIGGNISNESKRYFRIEGDIFFYDGGVLSGCEQTFSTMVRELVDYRLAGYEARQPATPGAEIIKLGVVRKNVIELPYFPNLKIACGHFKTGKSDSEEYRVLSEKFGRLDPSRHFIARASGNSMNGGKNPIQDGDYLLLEQVRPESAGSITGTIMAIERQDIAGDNQYLLRVVKKQGDGAYILHANNPNYEDMVVTDELKEQLRTFARLKGVINPLDMAVGQLFAREEIPVLFGESFNPGNWNSGHVVVPSKNSDVLLVTLSKQGKSKDYRYIDHWIDEKHFHWQSQNSTTPVGKRGRELIDHEKLGKEIHLFVREEKLFAGKAAPFKYYGRVRYESHEGSAPMSVKFGLID